MAMSDGMRQCAEVFFVQLQRPLQPGIDGCEVMLLPTFSEALAAAQAHLSSHSGPCVVASIWFQARVLVWDSESWDSINAGYGGPPSLGAYVWEHEGDGWRPA